MDDQKKVEEQVEDLDVPAEDAEQVEGGYSWGVSNPGGLSASPQLGADVRGQKVNPGGFEHQHNETLVRI